MLHGLKTELGGKWVKEVKQDLEKVGLNVSNAGNTNKINTLLRQRKFLMEKKHNRNIRVTDEERI